MALLTIAFLIVVVGVWLRSLVLALDEVNKTINQERHRQIMAKVSGLAALLAPILTGLQEAIAGFGGIAGQLDKAKTEIIKAVTDNDPEVPTNVTDKIAALGELVTALRTVNTALKTASQGLDDLNADAPAAEPGAAQG